MMPGALLRIRSIRGTSHTDVAMLTPSIATRIHTRTASRRGRGPSAARTPKSASSAPPQIHDTDWKC
jgi:hypothetical protein